MRRALVLGVLAVVGAAAGAPVAAEPQAGVLPPGATAWNMQVVAHDDLGGRGYNADVWVHRGYAYVGRWGFPDWAPGGDDRFCPSGDDAGAAVVDTREPSAPVRVATLPGAPGTSVEDVVVFTARYGRLAGRDIAAAGLQVCGGPRTDPSFSRGLRLWDVTVPERPVELGTLDTGCCTRGVHELEVVHRPDLQRTFAFATVPASEYLETASPSGRRDRAGRGDFRVVDVTDPDRPREVADWGVVKDLGAPPAAGQGCDPDPVYGHGAEPSDDGRLAFLAYWDSGFLALDTSDPAAPAYLGRTVYPRNADGDAHSSSYDDARRLLFTADEDFCMTSGADTEKGFGYLRVYDYSAPAAPRQVGEYRTPNSTGPGDQQAGDYVIHNPVVVGTDVYVSWYSDGIRVLDARDPRAPREVAHFVPPPARNPVKPSQRGVLGNTVQMWGVVVDEPRDLVYGSDMNSGLWILRRTDR